MQRLLSLITLSLLTLVGGVASAGSVGTYSGCKKLKGSAKSACTTCVAGGNFYQTSSKSCGLAPGMKASKRATTDAPPPIPTKMPATHKQGVTVPAGSFMIGAPESEIQRAGDEHYSKVKISRPFLMGATEVTENEWYFVMKTPSVLFRRACMDCPVTNVTWREIVTFMNALSKLDKLEPCYEIAEKSVTWKGFACTGYRLPTEAEWEYAARAGTEGPMYGPIDEIAWYMDNSDSGPHVGGAKKPNAFGLYDMIGNVSEQTWDQYDYLAFEKPQTDPVIGGFTVDESDGQPREHVVRGNSYWGRAHVIRVASRSERSSGTHVGFRWVRSLAKAK